MSSVVTDVYAHRTEKGYAHISLEDLDTAELMDDGGIDAVEQVESRAFANLGSVFGPHVHESESMDAIGVAFDSPLPIESWREAMGVQFKIGTIEYDPEEKRLLGMDIVSDWSEVERVEVEG